MVEERRIFAVVRVRGVGDMSPDVRKTLNMLRLNRNCSITLVDDRPSFLGMLKKVRHFVTWGEISKESILLLLKKRGRLVGNRKLDDEHVKKVGYQTLEEFAESIYKLETDFRHLPDIKPIFNAHPPRKGYKGKIKKSYSTGGVTGYRGEAINRLVEKML
ncbi:MAG: 50S ribosomal protein L30 [Candidatus Bathyarchaeota archaeon]|nr:MAG: 50S ribosomal protein L30 [Candidatus Bathyarchaeota archaeon]